MDQTSPGTSGQDSTVRFVLICHGHPRKVTPHSYCLWKRADLEKCLEIGRYHLYSLWGKITAHSVKRRHGGQKKLEGPSPSHLLSSLASFVWVCIQVRTAGDEAHMVRPQLQIPVPGARRGLRNPVSKASPWICCKWSFNTRAGKLFLQRARESATEAFAVKFCYASWNLNFI